ncbi:hypothetical protein RND81_05G202500 [Saponaria officinalis]|uniref:CW-type domain-containing protein n=1 Tax=Saponaria officinalis TaxID=3572 RepID=A0AAW1KYS4_SAPOF
MISVGSREEFSSRSNNNRRDIVMDDVELEEGEACVVYHDGDDDDPTIDPDVALSYIGEKLQNVLGHFQKDFEGLVSADSLGPKNGEYGTFLPAYRRSPVRSHPKSPPKVQNRHTPQPPSTLPAEGRNQNSVAAANVANLVKRGSASVNPVSSNAGNPVAQNERSVQIPKAQPIQEEFAPKSENRDQRTLKVRIKVGSDNLIPKKNTAIYSGLGLDDSPSPSFDDSLKESQGLSRSQTRDSLESPTQILKMMTSFPLYGGCVLSPLMDDLLQLCENSKYLSDIPVNPSLKVNQRSFSRENTMAFVEKESVGLQNKGDSNGRQVGFDFPSKGSDVDVVSCEELISNALKLPPLSDSYDNKKEDIYPDAAKSLTKKSNGVAKEGKSKDLGKQVAQQSSNGGDVMINGKDLSSYAGKKKTKKNRVRGSAAGKVVVESAKDRAQPPIDEKKFDTKCPILKSEGENLSSEKDKKKLKDKYSDFFGNLSDHEDEAVNSPPATLSKERLKTSEVVEKATLANDYILKEKTRSVQARGDVTSEMKNSSKSRRKSISGTPLKETSQNAFVPETSQPVSDQTFGGADSDVWVQCDDCKNWRLLPPGSKEDELPDKWRCNLQTWLPHLNHCRISEEEGIKVVRARYNLPPEIPTSLDVPLDKMVKGTTPLHPVVSNDGKLKKTSKSPFRDYSNGPSGSLKKKQLPAKVRTSAKSKDNQLTKAQQTKSSDVLLDTNKRKTSKQLQSDCLSDGGNFKSSEIKGRRESEHEFPRPSKRSKAWGLQSGNEMLDVSLENEAMADKAGKNQTTNSEFTSFGNLKDEIGGKRPKQELNAFPAAGSMRVSKSSSGNIAPKKRKAESLKNLPNSTPSSSKGVDDDEQSRSKRSRTSRSEGKEASTSKRSGKTDRKSRSISQQMTDKNEPLRKDSSSANVTATSSSSKVSLKVKYKFHDMKGSPVDSVSSSPLRGSIPDKLASKGIVEKNAIEAVADLKSRIDVEDKTHEGLRHRNGDGGADAVDQDDQCPSTAAPYDLEQNENEVKMSESHVNMPSSTKVHEERERDRKNRFQDNYDCKTEKNREPSVPDCRGQEGNDEKKALKMFEAEKPEPVKSMSMKEKSQCIPPTDGMKNETSNIAQSSHGNNLNASCSGDHPKETHINKKSDSQNGIHNGLSKHSMSNGHRVKTKEAPSPHKRDSLSQAASSAIKEATILKHLADRRKTADPMESTGLYFDAALKFLHGASLLESGKTESAKQVDIVQAMQIYSDTAKLCRFCAHEYEKSKDMATAALAYKCMEVAYLKVVYSSHNMASRDRSELQTVLQMVPPGESPSSSASDIDNLNNTATGDKAVQARSVDSPLLAGNLVIAAKNRPIVSRLLSFTQDVNSAMEASRKSHIAYGAASASMGHKDTMEGITSIKRALDFNFHDVEGLLRLVRLAKEANTR